MGIAILLTSMTIPFELSRTGVPAISTAESFCHIIFPPTVTTDASAVKVDSPTTMIKGEPLSADSAKIIIPMGVALGSGTQEPPNALNIWFFVPV